ncbi:hypothetical protein JX266_009403 [Neoarthrinium moseri]|uniref:uncharacterized protein n=1 Tax=Neoarthrinium moseri TaxID=1658444 RepID=UPI001FDB2E66|nr:uncharacterized protein JN550_012017 [Neoarthrinium moseri]KAI1844516.1 hypothetical protein JX266_009403 [Neoarthrinium moseri]KAI1859499.1 hypothetical protein JN550_012017 [Neoarthrinium moseri]
MAPHATDSDVEMSHQPSEQHEETVPNQVGDEMATPVNTDVCIIGAGPAGLMLACLLVRFGIRTTVFDERSDQTTVGRADGVQPKTIETMRMLGIGNDLMRLGKKIYDICIWRGSDSVSLTRVGRETHYPDGIVDILEPYILIGHQGMIEKAFLDDLHERGVEVARSYQFTGCQLRSQNKTSVLVQSSYGTAREPRSIEASYLVGCDGAHSSVRNFILEAPPRGSGASVWGVLDGELDTNFPDIWSKTVIFSEQYGSILIIPRERNMTRFYIEIKETASAKDLGEAFVKQRARDILKPYRLDWRSVEWFGKYQVAQRVAAKFTDPSQRLFIAGDASHAHSPKAAQGMNTSVHDTWNLGWKLNLAARGIAKPALLESYELERQKIARDLINFDYEHANQIAGGDADALAKNFRQNIRFISGVGADYAPNVINQGHDVATGAAQPGCNVPPAKATRYIDANPIDIQLDIPVLGQFRVYVFLGDITSSTAQAFLSTLSCAVLSENSVLQQLSEAAEQSYEKCPRPSAPEDVYTNPRSEWTVYLDDVPHLDTKGKTCTEKWLGSVGTSEAVIVNVRPDGYVGSLGRWDTRGFSGSVAAEWLGKYYGEFLQVPKPDLGTL